MNTNVNIKNQGTHRQSILKTILITLPMFLILYILIVGQEFPQDSLTAISSFATFLFVLVLFFLTIYTGKTYKYRKLLFVVTALAFPLPFISHYVELRGTMTFSAEEWLSSNIPFCQLVIPMIIIPAALSRTIIFPGQLVEGFASIGGMLVLWIGATLALGRGWCSWVCFYGGWDEGFAHLNKKPRLKIDKKWAYLPYAVLLVIVLISAVTLLPTYCEWLCPFKLVTEFAEITSVKILFQTIIFVSLFVGLVVVLPLLTGKRTQCTILCPFAAFQSFFNKINIFDIRIDTEKCKSCKKCIKTCSTLSIDEKSLENGKTRITCTKCGGCVDACPHNAVFYHIKGTTIGVRRDIARTIFLYPAFIFLGTLGGSFISGALLKLLKLATTGSII